MVAASREMQKYFDSLETDVKRAYEVAKKARKKGFDPEEGISVPLAKNMAERVEGLITSVAPQIAGQGVSERISELEKEHGTLSWKVALVIAKEVAEEKFCSFKSKIEAMEVGIRTGFAYHTVGVVAAPLEGFVELKLKKRRDGKEYFALFFSGPIRGAGGTAMGVCMLIADYVRKQLGYAEYDPDDMEIKRIPTEMYDYHDRVTNLQYKPSEEEIMFITKNLPVEVDGDPTENIEVSNYKDLPRIETNRIRGGMALVMSMIALKAPKLWKQVGKWGEDFEMGHWGWLEQFLKIQKTAKAKGQKVDKKDNSSGDKPKITPDGTFIADLVSGRPVLTHPLAYGGFRLRYGRSRVSGYSSCSIHPATMIVLNSYIATGTQIKTERPGKAASVTSCDTIEGPIVVLKDGKTLRLRTQEQAQEVLEEVKDIVFLGDILFSYGDFLDRAHPLVPVGVTEEQYAAQLKRLIETNPEIYNRKIEEAGIGNERLNSLLNYPLIHKPTLKEALAISKNLDFYMHPEFTPYFTGISAQDALRLLSYIKRAKIEGGKKLRKLVLLLKEEKALLESCGIPHEVSANTYTVLDEELSEVFLNAFSELFDPEKGDELLKELADRASNFKNSLELINYASSIEFRDRAGTFIGARMGRPEKAKMRKLTGSPHGLFPVGEQGGRMRSLQSAVEKGYIEADFSEYKCPSCGKLSVFPLCDNCGEKAELTEQQHSRRRIDVRAHFKKSLEQIKIRDFPEMIKGVRGTMNKTKLPEHPAKSILRAVNDVYVNKDGTIRYDMTELPITHFKPKEIGTDIERLKQLGYETDIFGKKLESDEQILELKPQDVVISSCPESPDEPADEVLFRIGKFVDDLLVRLYGLKPYYNFKDRRDTVGSIVIGLAPHTSAGIVGRVIGYSKTQSMMCHPLYHAAMRRDTDGDESCVIMLMDALLNFSRKFLPDRRGSRTMDAPLVLTSILDPAEVDDMVHNLDIDWRYPAELYDVADEYKMPWDVKITTLGEHLGTPLQYEKMGFTHDTASINNGVICSAYKLLPSMQEKLYGQMDIAEKVRAVNKNDVARLVIEKHLIRDIKGNLRKFSQQGFRCVNCNEKFRRPPLSGVCSACNGRVIFTISEGSIIKYLEPAKSLVKAYNLPPYLAQTIMLLDDRIEEVFGREKEKQVGLGAWF